MGIVNSNLPNVVPNIRNCWDWDLWLGNVDIFLKDKGYKKYSGHIQKEDFCYLKTFKNTLKEDIFQIGCLFYDFRGSDDDRVSVSYICYFLGFNESLKLNSSYSTMSIHKFENTCYDMYYLLSKKL